MWRGRVSCLGPLSTWPDPVRCAKGLGMKVARKPACSASVRTMYLLTAGEGSRVGLGCGVAALVGAAAVGSTAVVVVRASVYVT